MQASVIDMQRDPAFHIATNSELILVENKTPGQQPDNLSLSTLQVQLNYFWDFWRLLNSL